MKDKYFSRCVEQFGLPCMEQQFQRRIKLFALVWGVIALSLCVGSFYNLGESGIGWPWIGIDSLALAGFLVSGWRHYQLRRMLLSYRQKHTQTTSVRSFSNF